MSRSADPEAHSQSTDVAALHLRRGPNQPMIDITPEQNVWFTLLSTVWSSGKCREYYHPLHNFFPQKQRTNNQLLGQKAQLNSKMLPLTAPCQCLSHDCHFYTNVRRKLELSLATHKHQSWFTTSVQPAMGSKTGASAKSCSSLPAQRTAGHNSST